MTRDVTLVILSTTRIKDNSLVLHTISREFGRRSFIASVSRQCPAALFQALSILNAEVVENPKSQLWRVRNIVCTNPLGSIRSSVYKNTIALFMSEVLYRSVRDGEGGEELFDWICRSILTLEGLESDFSNFHLRFLLEFAQILGFNPEAASADTFNDADGQLIVKLIHSDFASFMLHPMNGEQRGKLAQSILDYISHHIEISLNIQSLKVLREVFA